MSSIIHKCYKNTKKHNLIGVSLPPIPNPTSKLLLPIHLVKEVLCSQEEVVDFAALLVPLGGVVHPQLRLRRQELADVGHRENDLLHGAVLTHNLNKNTLSPQRSCAGLTVYLSFILI